MEEIPENLKKAQEIQREMMRPDLYSTKETPLFTKEMKMSNIKRKDMEMAIEETDLAWWYRHLCASRENEDGSPVKSRFADFLINIRDARLSMSCSLEGFQQKMMNTTIQELQMKEEKKGARAIFERKTEGEKK